MHGVKSQTLKTLCWFKGSYEKGTFSLFLVPSRCLLLPSDWALNFHTLVLNLFLSFQPCHPQFPAQRPLRVMILWPVSLAFRLFSKSVLLFHALCSITKTSTPENGFLSVSKHPFSVGLVILNTWHITPIPINTYINLLGLETGPNWRHFLCVAFIVVYFCRCSAAYLLKCSFYFG